jgi:hypothetical protein
MRNFRWLAILPSVGGLAVSLTALTANAAPVAAQDAFGLSGTVAVKTTVAQFDARTQFDAQQEAADTTQAQQNQLLAAVHLRAKRLVWKKERAAARRQAARRAARRAAAERAAARRAAAAPTPSAAPAGQVGTAGMGAFEACVIANESGGNPSAVNPSSGAGGLFQFLPSTWASLGYPGLPQDAPVSLQEQAFLKLYSEAGTSPWAGDGCA